jgi:hypothetical protein
VPWMSITTYNANNSPIFIVDVDHHDKSAPARVVVLVNDRSSKEDLMIFCQAHKFNDVADAWVKCGDSLFAAWRRHLRNKSVIKRSKVYLSLDCWAHTALGFFFVGASIDLDPRSADNRQTSWDNLHRGMKE